MRATHSGSGWLLMLSLVRLLGFMWEHTLKRGLISYGLRCLGYNVNVPLLIPISGMRMAVCFPRNVIDL